MDSASNVSNSIISGNSSILDTDSILGTGTGTGSGDSGTGTGFFDTIKNISLVTWILIILILAFLGFNVFSYLAEGTQDITGFFGPFIKSITDLIRGITGQTINVAAEGGKAVVNATGNVTNAGLNSVQELGEAIKPNNAPSSLKTGSSQNSSNPSQDNVTNNALNKALNSAQSRKQQKQTQQQNGMDYEADEANSSIQGGGKSGWCFIGEDRGFRSCALVGVNDTCMSGDIFPSQEICVNPNLRQ
jgi:hypothetical protein